MSFELDDDILHLIKYYDDKDRYYGLQCYVERLERKFGLSAIKQGFAGTANGGFSSCMIGFFDYEENLSPTYHFVTYSHLFRQKIYIDVNALDLLRRLLESDITEFNGKAFEFIITLHNSVMNLCKNWHIVATSKFKNLILKRYLKTKTIPKFAVMQMAIELIIIKSKFKKLKK